MARSKSGVRSLESAKPVAPHSVAASVAWAPSPVRSPESAKPVAAASSRRFCRRGNVRPGGAQARAPAIVPGSAAGAPWSSAKRCDPRRGAAESIRMLPADPVRLLPPPALHLACPSRGCAAGSIAGQSSKVARYARFPAILPSDGPEGMDGG